MSDRDAISYSLAVERQTTSVPLDLKKADVTRYGLFLRREVDHAAWTLQTDSDKNVGIALD
jgi:hypothetical protein